MADDSAEELRGELRDQLIAALQRVPETAGRELTLTALSGGITNRNYLITLAGRPERYVIRLAGNDTHLLGISREVEHAATVAAAPAAVRSRSHYIARASGGHGAVREVCEFILDAQGALERAIEAHLQ